MMKDEKRRLCWALGIAAVALSINIYATTQDRTHGLYARLSALLDRTGNSCAEFAVSPRLACR